MDTTPRTYTVTADMTGQTLEQLEQRAAVLGTALAGTTHQLVNVDLTAAPVSALYNSDASAPLNPAVMPWRATAHLTLDPIPPVVEPPVEPPVDPEPEPEVLEPTA